VPEVICFEIILLWAGGGCGCAISIQPVSDISECRRQRYFVFCDYQLHIKLAQFRLGKGMFSNHFKIAWRSLWKNKLFSGINIVGLAIGIASCLLLLSYVAFQFSYDSFHQNRKDIYRVGLDFYRDNKLTFQSAENYSAVGPALKKDFPEVIGQARLLNMGYKNNCVFTYQDKHFKETKFLYADASFLTMFSFAFEEGNPATALIQPYTAVISESTSRKLFGNQNPIGQHIRMDDDDRNMVVSTVTGVFKDIPENSHIKFNILISYSTLDNGGKDAKFWFENNWDRKNFYTYILLRPGTDPGELAAKLPAFINGHIPGEKDKHQQSEFTLQPLEKIHLTSNRVDEPEETGNEKAVTLLIIIAIFIITIAWVNYINLSTTGALNRAKEIGVRKVLGSRRIQLIRQFMTEAIILNIISLTISLLLIYALQPLLDRFFVVHFPLSGLLTSRLGWVFIGFLLAGIFFSGLYPALVLSGFKPVAVLKGRLKTSPRGLALRKGLVTFQFSLSIFLIIGTLIVYQQVHFMLNQNLGMNTSQVMVLDRPGKWDTARRTHSLLVERFKETLEGNPAIEGIAMSDEIPGKEIRYPVTYTVKNSEGATAMPFNSPDINEDYLSVLGMKLLAGRNFSLRYPTDRRGLILTASAGRMLGFMTPEEAVGRQVMSDGDLYTILGVTNDFHQMSLQKQMQPEVFQTNARDLREYEYYLVKIRAGDIPQAVAAVESAWNANFKENPFGYYFLDDYFDRQYKSEVQFGIIFGAFSIIAIAIACIGLIALVAFMIEQRTKEIGVRKVLGAGMQDIVVLLTRDFVWLVFLANIIAWPLGWWLMNNWLKDFAYRIHIGWLVFIGAGAAAFVIALTTISIQAIKAALTNPIKSLRAE
jgi:putative ABC transport system permease protein